MKRARQPDTEITLYGDVFVKSHIVPDAGTIMPQHAHSYDHISYLAAGNVRVERSDIRDVAYYAAPAAIRIPARVKHTFTTVHPNTLILCIHNAAHGEAADIHEEHHLVAED